MRRGSPITHLDRGDHLGQDTCNLHRQVGEVRVLHLLGIHSPKLVVKMRYHILAAIIVIKDDNRIYFNIL